jgi:flagellar biosynthesis/type III secretory pathway protein FliH
MSQTVTVNLVRPIASAIISDGCSPLGGSSAYGQIDSAANAGPDSKTDKAGLSYLCRTLQNLVAKLNQFYDSVFSQHNDQIAKLSVEIARKVLLQKVQQGDYEIESIVKESLKNAPTRQDVVVHLNPEDLPRIQKLQQDTADSALDGLKFVADSNIGRAECLLETPKGIIESMIDEHLEQIAGALEKAD